MDLQTIENQISDAANDVGAEIEAGAKSLFATVTSAISSFLGLANPKWKQFAAEWKVWTWAKRVAFAAVVIVAASATYFWGSGAIRMIGGNVSAAVAYANGDAASKRDVSALKSESATALQRAIAAQKADVDALKQKLDALGDRFDGLSDSIQQLQAEIGAFEQARPAKPAAKITSGSVVRKPGAAPKARTPAKPGIWDQMKAVLP